MLTKDLVYTYFPHCTNFGSWKKPGYGKISLVGLYYMIQLIGNSHTFAYTGQNLCKWKPPYWKPRYAGTRCSDWEPSLHSCQKKSFLVLCVPSWFNICTNFWSLCTESKASNNDDMSRRFFFLFIRLMTDPQGILTRLTWRKVNPSNGITIQLHILLTRVTT